MKALPFAAFGLVALALCTPTGSAQMLVPENAKPVGPIEPEFGGIIGAFSGEGVVPQTEAHVAPGVNYDALLIRIQVLLDRAHFSPGVIDGAANPNLGKAIRAYETAHALPLTGEANAALLQTLAASEDAPGLIEYTLTEDDVRGPFRATPRGFAAMSRMGRLSYGSAAEALAEKFHMDEALLHALNPGENFRRAGTQVVVANAGGELGAAVASIVVDKGARAVMAFDASGVLVAFYPATVGSGDAPTPEGDYAVRAVTFNPAYRYDPARLPAFGGGGSPLTIAAGPNNPVGLVWIALSRDTYGIHGAPNPALISRSQSHGCVRLTNWDALELGHAVSVGVPVRIHDGVRVASAE